MRTVLMTGAGGGLGIAAVRRLADAGWTVFAADLVPPPAGPGVVPLALDVTDAESVDAAVREVTGRTGCLQGVVHFAGLLRVGALLDLDTATLARVLDVNVLGVHRVTRALLPLLVAGQGRVVVISSETAVQTAAPFNGAYAVSKHAVDTLGDALRRELALLGLAVVKVQPGPFRTAMVSAVLPEFERAAATSEHFGRYLRGMLPALAREQEKAHDPAELAAVVEQALTAPRPRPAYLVRPDRARMLLERLPVRVQDRLLRTAIRALARRVDRRTNL